METLEQQKQDREEYEHDLERLRKEFKQNSKAMDMEGVMDHRGGIMNAGPGRMMLDDDRFDSREYSEESSRAGRIKR